MLGTSPRPDDERSLMPLAVAVGWYRRPDLILSRGPCKFDFILLFDSDL